MAGMERLPYSTARAQNNWPSRLYHCGGDVCSGIHLAWQSKRFSLHGAACGHVEGGAIQRLRKWSRWAEAA